MIELKVSKHLRGNYEDYYKEGESEWRWLGAVDKADHIQTLCEDLPINSIIEIGAGDGSILKRLSDLNFAQELYALEISPSAVSTIMNRKIPHLIECSLFDGYNIPYNNKRFDLAVLSHVIEHVEYPRKLLYEAARTAEFIFVEVPLELTIRMPDDFIPDKVGHINFCSPNTIRRLIQTCGLRIQKQLTTNPSKDVYTFQKGTKGLVNFYIKEYLLKFFPLIATGIFTYRSSLTCVPIPAKS